MLNEKILKNEELAAYTLRSLYSRFGYTRYKMSKFEEYDLYVRNKDFLISDGIITFTDTNGKLLALKPDVTLSIIKNSKDLKGKTEKLYYDENVYRISAGSHSFKEIMQTGLECIGDVSFYDVCEVLYLALESLSLIDNNYILDLSHAGLFSALVKAAGLSDEAKTKAVSAIQNKSRDEVSAMLNNGEIDERAEAILKSLVCEYKNADELNAALSDYAVFDGVKSALDEFTSIYNSVSQDFADKIRIDFSIVSDASYYSGVVFKGYIMGIPQSVLSGGRYDKLMRKMGKSSGAVGFAVYLDMLERHNSLEAEYDYDYLLLRNESTPPMTVIKKVKELSADGKTVMVAETAPDNIRFSKIVDLKEGE